jgi:SWIM zinc finger
MALAPDVASHRAAARLAGGAQWSGTGAAGEVIWGLCAGSGQHPYQVIADISGPAYQCSCPSRKFPCKHALALMLSWAAGTVPEAGEPADFAASWLAARAARTARPRAGEPVRDEQAAARRAEQRASRVAAGLAELDLWLRDQVRAGLSATSGGYRHAEQVAARMVDAQASGVAGTLRSLGGISGTGPGWPGRLLAAYARLHLLIRAFGQIDTLPPGLAAVVRAHIGYPVARHDVLSGPAVTDRWLVLGVRDVPDGQVPARRILLRGHATARFGLLLIFDPAGMFAEPDAALRPGTALDADLHFYPGEPALRALIGQRRGGAEPAPAPQRPGGITALLDDWAAALALDPWLSSWPALVSGIPVPGSDHWQLADPAGPAVPLVTGEADCWPLLAISGGAPVTVAGEWSAAGLRPLTAWHRDQAVAL